MKAVWYPVKLMFDEEIKKQWKVQEVYPTKKLGRRVKGCSDFKYDGWFIVVEYCSDRLSVCLLIMATHGEPISTLSSLATSLRFKLAIGTLHYGDPDLFDKMVELVESFGPVFEANK